MSINVPPVLAGLLGEPPEPQGSFPWHRSKWQEQMHDLPEVLATIDQLPDRVDRQSTREVVLAELSAGRVLAAFIPAMIWGWGTTALGPLRTRWVLTEIADKSQPALHEPVVPTVETRLGAGIQAGRDHGPLGGFRFMNGEGRIKHFGPSYFTKWLYFGSAQQGPDAPEAAPILDKQIVVWLRNHCGLSLDAAKSASYAQYLELLGQWGQTYGLTRVQVEKVIFKLATGRG